MDTPVSYHAVNLLLIILAGFIIGLLFDFYRALQLKFPPPRWLNIVTDFLFFVLITALFFLWLLYISWGELRFYVFIGLGLGLFLYYYLLSKRIMFIYLKILDYVIRVFSFCFNVVKQILRLLAAPLIFVITPLLRVVKKINLKKKTKGYSLKVKRFLRRKIRRSKKNNYNDRD